MTDAYDLIWNPEQLKELLDMLEENTTKIRLLNDTLRTRREGGSVVITSGIAGLGPSRVNAILAAVAAFDGFTEDNDPYGEHDCAVMAVDGVKIIWKIDYYDRRRLFQSPDATNPDVTCRVMTIMRSDEY